MANQFIRKASLIVSAGASGLDLSAMRFRFQINQSDVETPNTASIRVYNLADQTVKQIQGEFSRVMVQAGYENGQFGVIFSGTIKQFRRGRERNVDSFLDILAADADIPYNFGFVNTTLAAGSSAQSRAQTLASEMGTTLNTDNEMVGGILPRGKVLFGLGRDYHRSLAASQGMRWSIQNGVVTYIPLTGYLPGQAVVLNSQTGLIGVPEATDNGIRVRALLNPLIKIGTRVQIDNKDINAITVKGQGFPSYSALNFPASVTDDGFYRVLVSELTGDTRGQEWYSELICLAIDPSSPQNSSVRAYG